MGVAGGDRKLCQGQCLDIRRQPDALSFPKRRKITPPQVAQRRSPRVLASVIEHLLGELKVCQFLRCRGKHECGQTRGDAIAAVPAFIHPFNLEQVVQGGDHSLHRSPAQFELLHEFRNRTPFSGSR